jgi:hypothetical protein
MPVEALAIAVMMCDAAEALCSKVIRIRRAMIPILCTGNDEYCWSNIFIKK